MNNDEMFGERMERIRSSLARITDLMREAKEEAERNAREPKQHTIIVTIREEFGQ